jgi:mRNA-degrading endonuclease toxin of MazEF toxin-antitoxin module
MKSIAIAALLALANAAPTKLGSAALAALAFSHASTPASGFQVPVTPHKHLTLLSSHFDAHRIHGMSWVEILGGDVLKASSSVMSDMSSDMHAQTTDNVALSREERLIACYKEYRSLLDLSIEYGKEKATMFEFYLLRGVCGRKDVRFTWTEGVTIDKRWEVLVQEVHCVRELDSIFKDEKVARLSADEINEIRAKGSL